MKDDEINSESIHNSSARIVTFFHFFLLEIGKEKTQMIIRQSYDKSSNLKSAYNDYYGYNQNIFTGLF